MIETGPVTITEIIESGVMYPFLIKKVAAVYDPNFNLSAPLGTILVVVHKGFTPNTFIAYKEKISFEIKDHKVWSLHCESGDNVISMHAFKKRKRHKK